MAIMECPGEAVSSRKVFVGALVSRDPRSAGGFLWTEARGEAETAWPEQDLPAAFARGRLVCFHPTYLKNQIGCPMKESRRT